MRELLGRLAVDWFLAVLVVERPHANELANGFVLAVHEKYIIA